MTKNIMRSTALIAALAATALVTSPAAAQMPGLGGVKPAGLGVPKMGLGGKSDAQPAQTVDVEAYLSTIYRAEELTRISAFSILLAVSSKEEAQKLRDTLKAAEAKTNITERDAALRQVSSDVTAKLAAVDFAAKSKELEGSATADQRKQLGVGLYNLMLAILMDKQALDQGQALISSISSNPMLLAKQAGNIGRAKSAIASVGGQMGNLGKIAVNVPKLMSTAKLAALPKSASEKPKAAAD